MVRCCIFFTGKITAVSEEITVHRLCGTIYVFAAPNSSIADFPLSICDLTEYGDICKLLIMKIILYWSRDVKKLDSWIFISEFFMDAIISYPEPKRDLLWY